MTIDKQAVLERNRVSWSKSRKPLLFLILAMGFVLFYAVAGTTSLWDNDEPTYAEIAKEMVVSGHWLTPMFNHEVWFCHPPLYMWLTAGIFKVLGPHELSARFFPCLFALLGMLFLFHWGSRWWNEKVGFMAAIILGTSLQYLVQGGMATMDTMLLGFLLLAFYAAWKGFETRKLNWWMLFFVACGLATLAKGVFGIAYPLFYFRFVFYLETRTQKNDSRNPLGQRAASLSCHCSPMVCV